MCSAPTVNLDGEFLEGFPVPKHYEKRPIAWLLCSKTGKFIVRNRFTRIDCTRRQDLYNTLSPRGNFAHPSRPVMYPGSCFSLVSPLVKICENSTLERHSASRLTKFFHLFLDPRFIVPIFDNVLSRRRLGSKD